MYTRAGIARLEETRRRTIWPDETARIVEQLPENGIFLTGAAGSDPAATAKYRDQLVEAHDFYRNYEARLENLSVIGINWLRFSPSYFEVHGNGAELDFEFIDKVLAKCKEQKITVIAELLQLSLADWLTVPVKVIAILQDPNFPVTFASYAKTFAKRYPQIKHYTLINEPHLLASTLLSVDEEVHDWRDDRQFVVLATNLAKAAILARKAIEHVWIEEKRPGEPLFVQSERFVFAKAAPGSNREAEAKRINLRRFAVLDLIFGHHDEAMAAYLRGQGISLAHYSWFMEHGSSQQTILGLDYTPTGMHTLQAKSIIEYAVPSPVRLYELVDGYLARYQLPLIHMEMNADQEGATQWCLNLYDELVKLRHEGQPIVGFGWYGAERQIDWPIPAPLREAPSALVAGLFHEAELQELGEHFAKLAATGLVTTKQATATVGSETTLSVRRT